MHEFLDKMGFEEELRSCGLPVQFSNRGYDPCQLIQGFLTALWCGASCYNDLEIYRRDAFFKDYHGWDKMAGQRAYVRYMNKFDQTTISSVFHHIGSWLFDKVSSDNITLDFDSTVLQMSGEQEGAAVGYNPKRKGRKSLHPILAFCPEMRMVTNFWLRPGNTSASTSFLPFLEDTLDRLRGKKVGLVRMDSGFFSGDIIEYLEMKKLHYIISCKFNNTIKKSLARETSWVEIAEGIEIAETTYKADKWTKARRIVMVRQDTSKRDAVGKLLKPTKKQVECVKVADNLFQLLIEFTDYIEMAQYRYSCYVTDLDLPMKPVYDSYRGRADSENRIKEIKYDFSLNGFVVNGFDANEACFNFIVLAYNLFSLFRTVIKNRSSAPFLKGVRYELFAIPGKIKRGESEDTIYLASPGSGRLAFKSIWQEIQGITFPRPVSYKQGTIRNRTGG